MLLFSIAYSALRAQRARGQFDLKMKILIQNGRAIDPASGLDKVCNVAPVAGRIIAVDREPKDFDAAQPRDRRRRLPVLPGLVDLADARASPGPRARAHAGTEWSLPSRAA